MIAALIAPIEMPATQSGADCPLGQRLVDAGLIGAERAAALEDEDGLRVERLRWTGRLSRSELLAASVKSATINVAMQQMGLTALLASLAGVGNRLHWHGNCCGAESVFAAFHAMLRCAASSSRRSSAFSRLVELSFSPSRSVT